MIRNLLKAVGQTYIDVKNEINKRIENICNDFVNHYIRYRDKQYTIYAKVDKIEVKTLTSIIVIVSEVIMVSDNNIIIEKKPIPQQLSLLNNNEIIVYKDREEYLDEVRNACDAYCPDKLYKE